MVDFVLIIIALGLLALLILLIAFLLEVRRLTREVTSFLERTETKLVPILANLSGTSVHLKAIAAQAEEGISKISDLFVAIGEGAGTVRLINHLLRSLMPSSVVGTASLLAGIRAGLAVLMSHWTRRRKER
jgi:uncharacterized protein YoxC